MSARCGKNSVPASNKNGFPPLFRFIAWRACVIMGQTGSDLSGNRGARKTRVGEIRVQGEAPSGRVNTRGMKMDLHDYKDVAENYDRYLEVMYANDDHHEHFQEFYLELARKYGAGGTVESKTR